jgi:hypothetical protein
MGSKIALNGLDPARTALVVVHMVKGVAGEVVTPFSRLFKHRAEQTGSSRLSYGCWTRSAGRRLGCSTPRSRTSRGSPGSARILRCGALSSIVFA